MRAWKRLFGRRSRPRESKTPKVERGRRVIANVKFGVFEIAADATVYQREEDGRLVRVTDEQVADEVYQAALQKQVMEGKRVALPRARREL